MAVTMKIARAAESLITIAGSGIVGPATISSRLAIRRATLRRDGARPCDFTQARAHDGWRRDRGKRTGQGLGVYGATARKRRQLTKDYKNAAETSAICCTALSPFLAQSGHLEASAYLSAFGGKADIGRRIVSIIFTAFDPTRT